MSRSFALLLLLSPALCAREADDNPAQTVAPYLDEQTFAVLHADLTRLELEPAFKQLEKMGLPKKTAEELRRTAKETLETLTKAGIRTVFVVSSMAHLPSHPPLIVMPLRPGGTGKGAVKLLLEVAGMKTQEGDNVLLAASEGGLKRLKERKPVDIPELASGFKAAGDGPLRLVLLPNKDMRRAFEELVPTFPRELGGGPTAPLTRGLRWASVGVSVAPEANVSVTVQTSDETSAKAIQEVIRAAFKLLGDDKEVRLTFPDFETLVAALTPKVVGSQLSLTLKEEQVVTMIAPALQRMREAASHAVIMNNMKQVGIAFHSYASEYKNAFPAHASFDKQNKPLLSWRVHLLPYLEQTALYKEFKLDEPWDSEHNKRLIKRMPKIYASASAQLTNEGRTTFVVPVGPGTGFPGTTGLKIAQVADGTSNTILAVEADEERAVIWTRPEDLLIDPKAPARGLMRRNGKVFLALFMDGSVRSLPVTIDLKTLGALFTPDGGEAVNLP